MTHRDTLPACCRRARSFSCASGGLVAGGMLLAAAILGIPPSTAAAEIQPIDGGFLRNYCVDCHVGSDGQGGLDLEALLERPQGDVAAAAEWARIHERVAAGEMPPRDADPPADDVRAAFLAGLDASLVSADAARIATAGRSTLRRLNRTEFQNTLRDVLALPELDVLDMLPPDGIAHGYDKSSAALDFSHVHLTQWLEVIDAALHAAVAPMASRPKPRVVRVEMRSVAATKHACQGLYSQLLMGRAIPMVGLEPDPTFESSWVAFNPDGTNEIRDPPPHFDGVAMFINGASNLAMDIRPFKIPVAGTYRLRVHGFGVFNDHGRVTPSGRTETVGFYTQNRTLGYCDLPSDGPGTAEITVWLTPDDRIKPLVATSTYPVIRVGGRGADAWRAQFGPGVVLQWFELEGPLIERWPPESHVRLFGNLSSAQLQSPAAEFSAGGLADFSAGGLARPQPAMTAESLIRGLAERAIRRPLTDSDLELPLATFRDAAARGDSLEQALLAAHRATLSLPQVVLLEEHPGPLDPHAVACRLSYFLWAAPPDADLRRLAAHDRLAGPELHAQVERMLDDPRAEAFVTHFLDQWLHLRDIELTEPDANLYPEFNPLALESMLAETRMFFREMIARDLGISSVVDSDFTFANQRLAELYDLEPIRGSVLRRVELPADSPRGGLLTQASVLKVTANGTTTSPVERGMFVMSQLVGQPPPPPPPTVPAVEPDISGASTIREQLARHRDDPSCIACHARIDPPGFALESFDVMGGFRTRYRSTERGDLLPGLYVNGGKPSEVRAALPVDPAATLQDGTEIDDVAGLRRWLLGSRRRELGENLLRQLIIYSTGSPIGFADRAEFATLADRLEASDFGLRSMIHEIVQSRLFLDK